MDSYGDSYPELEANKERIFKIITSEEEQFGKTIDAGLARLEDLIAFHKEKNDKVIPGNEAFKLYDTFGFPFDLTKEIAHEKDMDVNEEEFNQMMEEQKNRSRESREVDGGFHKSDLIETNAPKTEFTGYNDLTDQGKILEIYIDGEKVDEIKDGESGILIVDKTPFYGEGGGQIGDVGVVSSINAKAKVVNTQKNANETYFHFIDVSEGVFETGDPVVLEVDEEIRRAVMKNHSATHLLNQVLKEVLGDHIDQAGSYVSDDRFRFDFTHFEAISDEDLDLIERKVNKLIAKNLKVELAKHEPCSSWPKGCQRRASRASSRTSRAISQACSNRARHPISSPNAPSLRVKTGSRRPSQRNSLRSVASAMERQFVPRSPISEIGRASCRERV